MIEEFVEQDVIKAMDTMLSSNDTAEVEKAAIKVASVFVGGAIPDDATSGESEKRLVSSFQKNTALLVQKTWVEEDDVTMKEQVLYKLEQFCKMMADGNWQNLYKPFKEIIADVVYLMFGNQSRSKDFDEYALRIDPEFGIFWWYYQNLPETVDWSSEKCYHILLVGMFFLANY